jgi:hypothetical protein
MTRSPTTTELLDPLADLDGEDLACLGLRRADDFMDIFADLRRQAHDEWIASLPKPPKPPKPRKRSIRDLVEQAKAAGVTSVTLPDGTKLELGTPESAAAENPWLKVAKR